MGLWAVIKGDIVDGIAISDAPLEIDGGVWIDVTDMNPQPGRDWTYRDGVFSAPIFVLPKPTPIWVIDKMEMIKRFTNDEYVGILTAKKTDVTVEAWYDVFNVTSSIDLKNQDVINGLNFLASKNLLTQERANEILNTPAQPPQIPNVIPQQQEILS